MKKILLVALVSSLMVGCGGSDSDSNTTTNPTPNTPDTGAPEVNPKPDSENIVHQVLPFLIETPQKKHI